MRAVSLFSGIGGLDLGFQLAGIETVLQCESDAWCRRVLTHHWPEVARIDDVRSLDGPLFQQLGDDEQRRRTSSVLNGRSAGAGLNGRVRDPSGRDIDLIYGGFPCQDLSVAGKRAGLSGKRSGLWFEFRRVLSELRPRWVCIENVPGLLSSGITPGADFGVLLRGLVDLGYGVAWRVLDARWFGTPQRRRRVFVVGCLGDGRGAAQVLAVCESCGGHSAAGGEAGQDVAYALAASARGTGDGHGNAWNSNYVAATLSGGEHPSSNMPGRHHEDDDNLIIGSVMDDGQARPLSARESGYRMDWESENFVVAGTVRAADGHHGRSSPRGDGGDNQVVASGVRRLTPLECERLQGFPDGWTDLGIADAHRYRMLGNAVNVAVAQWLGHRLVWVDQRGGVPLSS